MSRLTKKKLVYLKYGEFLSVSKEEYRKQVHEAPTYKEIYTKLGKLEDLEDELGCPLDVVCKLRTEESIIVKGYGNEFETWETDDFYLIWGKEPYIEIMKGCEPFRSYKLKDYGKTWWLKGDRK